MDEPTEAWEQPPAPPVAFPGVTAHADVQHFMHRQAKDAGKPCPCDWCDEHGYEIADLTDEIWALKQQVKELTNYALKLKGATAEPVRQPPAINAYLDEVNFRELAKTLVQDARSQRVDLKEIRKDTKQANHDLKTMDKVWRDVRRARLYEWGEMLWIPMFILIVVLSYIFP